MDHFSAVVYFVIYIAFIITILHFIPLFISCDMRNLFLVCNMSHAGRPLLLISGHSGQAIKTILSFMANKHRQLVGHL